MALEASKTKISPSHKLPDPRTRTTAALSIHRCPGSQQKPHQISTTLSLLHGGVEFHLGERLPGGWEKLRILFFRDHLYMVIRTLRLARFTCYSILMYSVSPQIPISWVGVSVIDAFNC